MARDPLLGPLLKVKRAEKHIDEFDAVVRQFADRHPYRIVIEPSFDPSNTAMVALTLRIREQIPDELPLIVGDAVHNLRSALDQLACCLVPNGADDPAVQFPFTKNANTLAGTIQSRHIDRAKPAAVTGIVDHLKPYAGGNDALHGIHVLDNTDKHRLLIPVVGVSGVKNATLTAAPTPGASVIDLAALNIRGANDGQKLIVIPKPTNLQLGDELDATIEITFGDGPFENFQVSGWLRQLVGYIGVVIENFRPFLPSVVTGSGPR